MEPVYQLKQTPEFVSLLQLLRGLSETTLQQAADAAKAGDYQKACQLLQPVLDEKAKQLASELEKQLG